MAFMIKKKCYKFSVDLSLDELTEVSYSRGILFAKIRQLDGGSFTDVSKRMEVRNHIVRYQARFHFPCKIYASASSGILGTCKCRISIRMEEKGGKHFRKIGFADINLSEYAGAGPSTQRYILQAYNTNHRLDNSMLQVTLNITLREGDTIFQRPLTRRQPISLPGEEFSSSSSLPLPAQNRNIAIPNATELVKHSNSSSVGSMTPILGLTTSSTTTAAEGSVPVIELTTHTRSSSSTSQASAGYASSTGVPPPPGNCLPPGPLPGPPPGPPPPPGHSRQSSSGDSTHGRKLSQGSSDTGFFGSMEREQHRRKKLDEGRVDAELVINELMEGVDLDKVAQDDAETSGLQLFVRKDGTVTFDKSYSRKKDFEPVVIVDNLR